MKKTTSSAEKRALGEIRRRHNINAGIAITPPPQQSVRTVKAQRKNSAGRWIRRAVLIIILGVVLGGGVFGFKIISASNKISVTERSILGQLKDLLFNQGKFLAGEQAGRVNIMLIAIGGVGHQGQNLADTIMIVSIKPETKEVALLSVPRDLYVQVPGEDYFSKINAVHAHGESIKAGRGPNLLKEAVEEVTGLPIHYFARADFTAFKQIVDAVGGVTIAIDNSFFDYWHKIAFSAGTEKMDGERALAYVRARYIEGPEGGDFKRADRQQQILLALREKVFSVDTALDFTALNNILNTLSDNIRTDLQLWEMKRFYEISRMLQADNVKNVVLTTGPKGLLVGTTEILGDSPASVLKTRTGNYEEIHQLAGNIFTTDATPAATPTPTATPLPTPTVEKTVQPEKIIKPSIEIRNGTNITGLAKQKGDELAEQGYEVIAIGNAATRDQATTTAYILNAATEDGANSLLEKLSITAIEQGLPDEETASSADLLLILGQDDN